MKSFCLALLFLVTTASVFGDTPKNFLPENLVAWCIVPFDANKRTPAERALMLKELGIGRLAYDWRAEHVPSFEEEILAMQEQGIEFSAFWRGHEAAYPLFAKHGIKPQIWQTVPSPKAETEEERISAAALALEPSARQASELGCSFGLYNHGGWGGEPETLVAVCQRLREMGYANTGIVYNWHHGHEHIRDWSEVFPSLKPYLLCLNLNGMNSKPEPKIISLSQGEHELEMLKTVLESGYDGPVGILDHRNELDAKTSIGQNLKGLKWLLQEAEEEGSGGPKPSF